MNFNNIIFREINTNDFQNYMDLMFEFSNFKHNISIQ